MKRTFLHTAFFISACMAMLPLCAQEALKSSEEEYYDFLSLSGIVERPTLGYRTLSDSVWNFRSSTSDNQDEAPLSFADSDANVWKNNNLGTTFTLWHPENASTNWYLSGVKQGFFLRAYGPEWYNSYNTAAPYGQNDGALWQGRGYNTSLTGGIRLEGYGLELTLKPQVCFQQNLEFEIMPSTYDSEYGYFWGYAHNVGVDCPQRFGDSPFWTFDWGDSEIRYTWGTATIGFGTQAVWLGPAWLNPLLLSNNAATFPKFDFGIRKTPITIPWINWYAGDIEARAIIGYLSESDYFDNDDTNNHNLFNVFSLYFSPSFLPGLIVGANKVCLSKWGDNFWKYVNPFYDENEEEDQKASITFDWLSKKGELEIYSEIGIDDYTPDQLYGLIRYPFDTMMYTVGFKKIIYSLNSHLYGELIFEWNTFEKNAHRSTGNSTYTYYFHNLITQGYTNKGQYLGCGLGCTDSQYLGLFFYFNKGNLITEIQRYNCDDDYAYLQWNNNGVYCYKSNLVTDVKGTYFIKPELAISCLLGYDFIINPYYKNIFIEEENTSNFIFQLAIKYSI